MFKLLVTTSFCKIKGKCQNYWYQHHSVRLKGNVQITDNNITLQYQREMSKLLIIISKTHTHS